jgi:hypothetical protein
MRVTIIPSDNIVAVDGKVFRVDCSSIDPDIHAVQWYGALGGEIEYKAPVDGGARLPNENISDFAPFQPVVNLWIIENNKPPPQPSQPPAFLVPPYLVASALGMAVTPATGDISSVGGMFNIGAAMYLDVGVYWMFFVQSQPDTNYFAIITGAAVDMTMTERGIDYFVIEAKDASGNHIDPPQLSVQVYRTAQT